MIRAIKTAISSKYGKCRMTKMKKVFVLYYDDENGETITVGIISTFEKAEKIINDNFKVSKTFCDSNMVTYETEIGLLIIQEWNVDDVVSICLCKNQKTGVLIDKIIVHLTNILDKDK